VADEDNRAISNRRSLSRAMSRCVAMLRTKGLKFPPFRASIAVDGSSGK